MKMKTCALQILLCICCFIIVTQLHSQTISCGFTPQQSAGSHTNFQLRSIRVGDADSVYTLPVVVHVIHTGNAIGAADNPADSLIKAMIDNLNKAWRKNGAVYGGADLKIQFQLATKSPSCTTTTGINRIDGSSIANYASGGITNTFNPSSADEVTVKNLSRWPNTDYINIWIVNKINGSTTSPGGYAYFPEYNSADIDGIVLQASVVNGINKTIVHEMGHVFYLLHTFADGAYENTCAPNLYCNTQGDLICDTEPTLVQSNCSSLVNTCTGNAYTIADAEHNYTVLNNYMGYANCQWMFTEGQKERARAALLTYRHGLISSGGLSNSSSPVTAACIPSVVSGLSSNYGIQQVDFNTLSVYSNTSEADGSHYIDRTCNQSTTVTKGKSYTLSVTGSYENPHNIKAYMDYNNDGNFDVATETILSVSNKAFATTTVTIPLTGVVTNKPLRLRIIAENPTLADATPCRLNGTTSNEGGQVEDYAVIILPRQITSVATGNWNSSSTWSCNCVPQNDDEVTINAGHTITVTAAAKVASLKLLDGAKLNVSSGVDLQVGNAIIK